jgi:hypothetical protein
MRGAISPLPNTPSWRGACSFTFVSHTARSRWRLHRKRTSCFTLFDSSLFLRIHHLVYRLFILITFLQLGADKVEPAVVFRGSEVGGHPFQAMRGVLIRLQRKITKTAQRLSGLHWVGVRWKCWDTTCNSRGIKQSGLMGLSKRWTKNSSDNLQQLETAVTCCHL